MGIVYSSLAPTAVRLAYICQKLFDPKYSCIEDVQDAASNTTEVSQAEVESTTAAQQQAALQLSSRLEGGPRESALPGPGALAAKSNSLPRYGGSRSPEYDSSTHQLNRMRRARQLRFRTRPSSFDGALIVRTKTKNAVIVTSAPSPLSRHWDVTSSSGCSSDSNSDAESDSETELRVSATASNEEIGNGSAPKLGMTAEEEEAFRLTLGRGHFTRSKKDHFLNNLRLQKQSIHRQATLW